MLFGGAVLWMLGVLLVNTLHMPKQSFRRHFPVQCAVEHELLEALALAARAISPRLVTLSLWKYNEGTQHHWTQNLSMAVSGAQALLGEYAVREVATSGHEAMLCNTIRVLVQGKHCALNTGRPHISSRHFLILLLNWHLAGTLTT